MAEAAPAEILLDGQALTLLHRLLDAAEPEEGCGLLLGCRGAPQPGPPGAPQRRSWLLRKLWPCCNVWEPEAERRRRFAIDPREQLQAIRWARQRGLEVLGSVHSHPLSEAVPSATDRALAVTPALMLIRGRGGSDSAGPGLAGAGDPVLRCWWLQEGAQPQLLPWRMED